MESHFALFFEINSIVLIPKHNLSQYLFLLCNEFIPNRVTQINVSMLSFNVTSLTPGLHCNYFFAQLTKEP